MSTKTSPFRLRPAHQRFHTQLGWLNSHHSFAFGHHYHPDWLCHRGLRVINDDIIAPGAGFDWHGHRDMEIITWVLSGAVLHRDSTGTESIIRPGMAQHMRAGSGIQHGEWNASHSEELHLLQIWIEPAVMGLSPGHWERHFSLDNAPGQWHDIAVPHRGKRDDAFDIAANARMLAANGPGELPIAIEAGRSWWLHLATGRGQLADTQSLEAGDGMAIAGPFSGTLKLEQNSQVLAFDLG